MSNKSEAYKKLIDVIDGLELELKIKQEELKNRDNIIKDLRHKIKELRHNIFELETRIDIFQNQITPSVAESIKKYRTTINNFEILFKKKDKKNQQLENLYINLKIKIRELIRQDAANKSKITKLNDKINFLPIMCNSFNEEIKERDKKIHILSEENAFLKQKLYDNTKDDDIKDITDKFSKINEMLDEIENKNKIIKYLKNQILEQKNKIQIMKQQ